MHLWVPFDCDLQGDRNPADSDGATSYDARLIARDDHLGAIGSSSLLSTRPTCVFTVASLRRITPIGAEEEPMLERYTTLAALAALARETTLKLTDKLRALNVGALAILRRRAAMRERP